ncbi:MAG: CBS domain-containing protein [Granulosicoccus sp.]
MKEPRLKSIMTPFPYSVELSAPLTEARTLMDKHTVRHLPVTRQHELQGVITDRDILLLLGPQSRSTDVKSLLVEDAYVEDCYQVDLGQPLRIVLHEMAKRHIGSAVVTAHGRLAGIITATDVFAAFADHLNNQFHHGESDPPEYA